MDDGGKWVGSSDLSKAKQMVNGKWEIWQQPQKWLHLNNTQKRVIKYLAVCVFTGVRRAYVSLIKVGLICVICHWNKTLHFLEIKCHNNSKDRKNAKITKNQWTKNYILIYAQKILLYNCFSNC